MREYDDYISIFDIDEELDNFQSKTNCPGFDSIYISNEITSPVFYYEKDSVSFTSFCKLLKELFILSIPDLTVNIGINILFFLDKMTKINEKDYSNKYIIDELDLDSTESVMSNVFNILVHGDITYVPNCISEESENKVNGKSIINMYYFPEEIFNEAYDNERIEDDIYNILELINKRMKGSKILYNKIESSEKEMEGVMNIFKKVDDTSYAIGRGASNNLPSYAPL